MEDDHMNKRTCTVEGCGTAHYSLALCQKHYARLKRHGTTDDPKIPTLAERFWAKVAKGDGCWQWTGAQDGRGYASFAVNRKSVKAHRHSLAMAGVEVLASDEVDHICHNRMCVNPRHLRVVTHKQNNENHNGPTRGSASGVRGVWLHRASGLWTGQVNHSGVRHNAGYHQTVGEAEAAVLTLRNALHSHNDLDRAT